jgi:cytoskeleton protein RodZ
MSKVGFGEDLKREREMRGVSLEEICAATRISTRFLEALEKEEWDRLPGGVFNRGFVRAVARFLGLDEEGLVAEYALAASESKLPASSTHSQPPPQPATRRPLWIGLLLAIALVAAGWLGWRTYAKRRSEQRAAAALSSSPASIPAPNQVSEAYSTPNRPAPPDSPANNLDAADPAVPPDGILQLQIEAGKATTLTVLADGKEVFDGNIIAGQSRAFGARDALTISARDAGALLLELNGQTLAPIGPPGRPGKVTLTRRDLKAAAPGGLH